MYLAIFDISGIDKSMHSRYGQSVDKLDVICNTCDNIA